MLVEYTTQSNPPRPYTAQKYMHSTLPADLCHRKVGFARQFITQHGTAFVWQISARNTFHSEAVHDFCTLDRLSGVENLAVSCEASCRRQHRSSLRGQCLRKLIRDAESVLLVVIH